MATKKRASGTESPPDSRPNESEANRHPPASSVQPVEHGAKQGTPDRQQRVLRGNTEDGAGERHPDQPAAQHATGSFTGETTHNAAPRKKNGQK